MYDNTVITIEEIILSCVMQSSNSLFPEARRLAFSFTMTFLLLSWDEVSMGDDAPVNEQSWLALHVGIGNHNLKYYSSKWLNVATLYTTPAAYIDVLTLQPNILHMQVTLYKELLIETPSSGLIIKLNEIRALECEHRNSLPQTDY